MVWDIYVERKIRIKNQVRNIGCNHTYTIEFSMFNYIFPLNIYLKQQQIN